MRKEEISTKVCTLFAEFAELEPEEVTEESELIGDLGLSSMEILSAINELEEFFCVDIPEKALRTFSSVADIVSYIAER